MDDLIAAHGRQQVAARCFRRHDVAFAVSKLQEHNSFALRRADCSRAMNAHQQSAAVHRRRKIDRGTRPCETLGRILDWNLARATLTGRGLRRLLPLPERTCSQQKHGLK
jgi:hypothetical protein